MVIEQHLSERHACALVGLSRDTYRHERQTSALNVELREQIIQHILIEPGSPTQNAYIESFNGRFRDECLDENWFESLEQARQTIARWRLDYNETRPHSSCGRVPPETFAALNRQLTGDSMQHQDRCGDQLILQTSDLRNLDGYGNWGRVTWSAISHD